MKINIIILGLLLMNFISGFSQNSAFSYRTNTTSKAVPTYTNGQYVSIVINGFDLQVGGSSIPYLGNNRWGYERANGSTIYRKISDNEFYVEKTVVKMEEIPGSHVDRTTAVTYTSSGYLMRSSDGSRRH